MNDDPLVSNEALNERWKWEIQAPEAYHKRDEQVMAMIMEIVRLRRLLEEKK